MKTSVTKVSDEKHFILFEHKGVKDSRVVDTPFDDKGKIDSVALKERVAYLASAIQTKIDMGLITEHTVSAMGTILDPTKVLTSSNSKSV